MINSSISSNINGKIDYFLDNGVNELKATVSAAAVLGVLLMHLEGFKSYSPQVIHIKKKILMNLSQSNENLLLRGMAIDTDGTIAVGL
ncbi:hypothetical protein Glove_194g67 [Diversispora epigaea]|uniref:Uncharacterized protein n=1 Tax=Diversispora epigaea TaxID=1348612 RepID=A0A397IVS6_9GLOM|nr:hypothetical protein Glove_194g67 [Diversispora epigaea]